MVIRWKHIIRWSVEIGILYFLVHLVYFFNYGIDPENIAITIIGNVLVAVCSFIFGYGVVSLIHDFRSGGWRAICDKLKTLWKSG